MAKAKKRVAARKKSSKRGNVSAKPARKLAAKRATPKKAKAKKPAAEKKRPLDTAGRTQVAQMPVETTVIDVIDKPAPGVGVETERGEVIGPARTQTQDGRDAEAVREVAARGRPVAASVCGQGKLVSCPQVPFLSGDPAGTPDDLKYGLRHIDAWEKYRVDFAQLKVRADGPRRSAADEVRGAIEPVGTVALPATTNPDHLTENVAAMRGPLPDAAMRKRMVSYMETIPGFATLGNMPWYPGKNYLGVIAQGQAAIRSRG